MARKPLKRGDLIKVTWIDATDDSVGDPDTASCVERVSYGLFWSQGPRNGHEILVTTTTIDSHGTHQSGYSALPIGMVTKIEVIKRGKP